MATTDSTVTYKNITGFPGYRVGNDGSVWTRHGNSMIGRIARMAGTIWHKLKFHTNGSGHVYVHLYPGRKYRLVHRLVLSAFVGPCPSGMQCCHTDGNPANNVLSNLRWDTPLANMADMVRHGRSLRGEQNPGSKLTAEQVRAMRAEYVPGVVSQQSLADKYGVNQHCVSLIVRRKKWRHI